jgi:uncharacterized protein (DUF2126 family)/transglutaminase-like putative cysteine protease
MAIHVALNHLTRYTYDRPVLMSPHVVRLRPAPHCRAPIHAYSLKIQPSTYFINWQQDPFGNYLARLVFPEKVREFSVEVDVIASMLTINPFDFFLEEGFEHYPLTYEDKLKRDLLPYLHLDEDSPRLYAWLKSVDQTPQRMVDFLVSLNQSAHHAVQYTIRLEAGVQSCEETLTKGSGSCRDSAWLLVQALRHLGLAARFVSGYLVQLSADVKSLDGPSGPEKDFTDLHAWTEVYLPGAGWVGLDPTSGLFAGEGHIPLSCTPHPSSAAPITGAVDPCETTFYFHNEVRRIHEDPRTTKPYTEEQWQEILTLGEHVDKELNAHDVRLTMGGEPTFISIDDMDGEEWNTAALGESKQKLAETLLHRLRTRFAPGGVLHYGQGKWYPGEALPRWALSCYWRADGRPVWKHPNLYADTQHSPNYENAKAQRFAAALATRLGLDKTYLQPAYEDALYYVWKEGQIPPNLDPSHIDLKQDQERQRLATLLQGDLNQPVGYVLPLKHQPDAPQWCSSLWQFRRGRLFLLPGDSPLGLRLPLDSLPWEEKRESESPRSLFEARGALIDSSGEVARQYSWHEHNPPKNNIENNGEIIHTALCTQVRAGQLYVFLPPLSTLEDWLELVSIIESTCNDLELRVFLEGYPPPHDWRLLRFSITPDPGVIEVNIHPAHTWEELVRNTEILYAEAQQSRLGTEKFMLDGRHTGTGGGNHVTLGGPTPADSPVLRRPDLLGSLLTYWQHHPSLSYLFSGLFIGPSSQAPRIDEARHESLYELEIALQQMPSGETPSPWLVDRLFRHLLVDLSGNTHRAEFCIDKLYSPDSAHGRLGLVEMRAFEMPPHARMSVMQMLLLRTLIARFWQQPYRRRLTRWGTALHDRWMLPHFIEQDIKDVVQDLQAAGYAFRAEWFDPFIEFRFPTYGNVHLRDIHLNLRMAIEPWHVLGEEISTLGTARFVDSSVERLQVKVTGLSDSRYILTCNGRAVPLHNTGTQGEYVAGVRYKAWQPPSSLHPNLNVDVPLVFDLFDTWNQRSLGGCTYHVAHPGGLNYDTFPVNAYEAESRRISRFESIGHTPKTMRIPIETKNCEYPYTLDLRFSRL